MKLPRKALLALTLACTAGFLQAQSPAPVSLDSLKLDELASPFLLLSPPEIQALKARIAGDPATQARFALQLKKAEDYAAKPLLFPEHEGTGRNQFICSVCTQALVYNPESPHRHFCAKCKEHRESAIIDQAWNTITFFELSKRMEVLGAVALLSGDRRYATALKDAWLDLASKYSSYHSGHKGEIFSDSFPATAGIATRQSIEEAFLTSKLAYSWDALLGTKILSPQEQAQIEKGFWKFSAVYFHRVLDLHGSGGNWWVWHCSGALAAGIFGRDMKLVDKAYNMPKCGIVPFLATGYVRSDGLCEERSASYQFFAMEALSRIAHLSKRLGIGFDQDHRIRSAFTAYTAFLLPDLSLPCMNDTARFQFTVPDENDNFGCVRYLNILDVGWNIHQAPEMLKTMQILESSQAVAKSRQERLYALLYGPTDVKPVPFALPSVYTSESAIALLRSPEKDWNLLFKNVIPTYGHSHPDALQISMFANGEEFLPAFGAGNYALLFYPAWYTQTLGSNSVVVNRRSQVTGGSTNRLDWGITRGPVQAAHGTASKIQGLMDQGTPISASRLVMLTPLAMYEILRVEEDATIKDKKVTQPINQLESVLHFSGELTWEPAATAAPHPWTLPTLESLKAEFAETQKNIPKSNPKNKKKFKDYVLAYRQLDKPEALHAAADGFFHGQVNQPRGGKVALALFPMAKDQLAWQFYGPGFESEPQKRLPLVIRGLTGNQARFGTVAIPFRENNPLRSVKLLVDTPTTSILSLETSLGSETVFSSAKSAPLHIEELHADFTGFLGIITQLNEKTRLYTLVGTTLSDARGQLNADAQVPIQMRLEENNPVFSNLGGSSVTVSWTPAGGGAVVTKTVPAEPH